MRTTVIAFLLTQACGWAIAHARTLAAQAPPITRCDSLRAQFPDGGAVTQPAEPFPDNPLPVLPDTFVARNDTVIARFVVDFWGRVGKLTFPYSNSPRFLAAVRAVLPRWRFRPALIASGCSVPQEVEVPFVVAAREPARATSPLDRILLRRVDSLTKLPAFRSLLVGRTASEIVRGTLLDLGRLNDSVVVRWLQVLVRTFNQMDTMTCGRVWKAIRTPDAERAVSLLAAQADSALAEEWAEVLVAMLLAEMRQTPTRARASPEEVDQATAEAALLVPRAEVEEYFRIRAKSSWSDAEQCVIGRTELATLLRVPPAKLAPVLRAYW